MAVAHFWISYRIHSDSTYEERYDALRGAISDAAIREWNETTSFHLIASKMDIDKLGEKLKKTIKTDRDRIVIRRLNAKVAVYIGKFNDLDELKFFMPYAYRI